MAMGDRGSIVESGDIGRQRIQSTGLQSEQAEQNLKNT